MDKPDYFAMLGLQPSATAADIESSYLAISQFLDGQTMPTELRRWAATQSALVDEAYAALTESVDEEPLGVKPRGDRRGSAGAARSGSGVGPKTGSSTPRRPTQEPEYFEDEDDFDEFEEDYEPGPRQQSAAQSKPAKQGTTPGKARSSDPLGQPRWEERGKKRGSRRGRALPQGNRRAGEQGDDRMKKMAMGVGAGLLIVILGFLLIQSGVGPFARPNNEQATDQQVPLDEARYKELTTLVQKSPQNFAALFELGQMTFESQRYEESISWLEKALTVKPDDVLSIQDIGTANFNLGNPEKARQMWLRALEIDPNNPQTHWNIGFYYASRQPPDMDSALQEWQKVLQFAAPTDELYKVAQTHVDQYKSRTAGSATSVPATPATGTTPVAPGATPRP